MSDPEIKQDTGPTPRPSTGSAFFRNYNPSAASGSSAAPDPTASAQSSAAPPKTMLVLKRNSAAMEPKWKQEFAASEQVKQITIMENAVNSSMTCLHHMVSMLKIQSDAGLIRLSQLFMNRINAVLALNQPRRILVGVRGVTGSGKSTLINALLGTGYLLPMQPGKACTAVVVEVAYNYSNDPEALYRADVEFATRTEWEKELEVLFEDLKTFSRKPVEEHTEEDLECRERILDALATLKYVYPDLKSIPDLRDTSVSDLLDDKNVKHVLSSTKHIQGSKKGPFQSAIVKYIATQGEDRKTFTHWPLVKRVKVFIKHDLLKSGIVLVDLPGSMDTNAARGAVAANYQKHLAVTCMVVDARRGIDDQNAHTLIEELLKRDLQMDGAYNSDHLCFILSQYDRDFDVGYYLRQDQNKALRKSLQPIDDQIKELKRIIKERNASIREIKAAQKENADEMEELEAQIETAKSAALQTRSGPDLKRKRGQRDDIANKSSLSAKKETEIIKVLEIKLSELQEKAAKAAVEQIKFSERLSKLTKGLACHENNKIVACSNDRKSNEIAAVRKDFERTQQTMGITPSKPLPVFCVASQVYLDYENRNNRTRQKGFPTKQETEIPKLRDWLHSFTFEGREKSCRSILEEVERLVSSMRPWIEDRRGDVKISLKERAEWEPKLEAMRLSLGEELSKLSFRVANSIKELVEARLYSQMSEVEKQAAKTSQDLVFRFGRELRWNTHLAVNQRRGQWVDVKRGKDHKWNDRIVNEYTTPLVKDWVEVFFSDKCIQQDFALYTAEAKLLITNFAALATAKENCPDILMELQVFREELEKASDHLTIKTEAIFEKFRLAVRESHREAATPAIRTFLTPMYNQCGEERGTGHFKRNRETHASWMEQKGVACHHEATRAIQDALNENLDGLPTKLLTSQTEVLEQIRNEIELILEHNTSKGGRNTTRRIQSKSKAKLQNILQSDIDDLFKAWNEETVFKAEELDNLADLDFEQDDKFYLKRDGDDEDDEDDEDYID